MSSVKRKTIVTLNILIKKHFSAFFLLNFAQVDQITIQYEIKFVDLVSISILYQNAKDYNCLLIFFPIFIDNKKQIHQVIWHHPHTIRHVHEMRIIHISMAWNHNGQDLNNRCHHRQMDDKFHAWYRPPNQSLSIQQCFNEALISHNKPFTHITRNLESKVNWRTLKSCQLCFRSETSETIHSFRTYREIIRWMVMNIHSLRTLILGQTQIDRFIAHQMLYRHRVFSRTIHS